MRSGAEEGWNEVNHASIKLELVSSRLRFLHDARSRGNSESAHSAVDAVPGSVAGPVTPVLGGGPYLLSRRSI